MICQQHYCRRTEPISLKLVVMIRHISRKNLTTFGGNPVRETVFGSLSHISHHCVIRRFISIVHSHRPIFTTLGEMTDGGKIMNPQHFGSDPDTNQDWSSNPDSNATSLSVKVRRLGGGPCSRSERSSLQFVSLRAAILEYLQIKSLKMRDKCFIVFPVTFCVIELEQPTEQPVSSTDQSWFQIFIVQPTLHRRLVFLPKVEVFVRQTRGALQPALQHSKCIHLQSINQSIN